MAKAPGKPSISASEAERVVKGMERLYKGEFKENKTALARALGVSQPAVTQILKGTNRPSIDTAKAVARLEGNALSAYLDESADPDEEQGPFPSKSRAARSAFLLEYPAWAIETMMNEPPPDGMAKDPGVRFWFRRVEQLMTLAAPPGPGDGRSPDTLPGTRRKEAARTRVARRA